MSLHPAYGAFKEGLYLSNLAKGNIPGKSLIRVLGERESMSTTPAGEDIWRGNELTPAPTSNTELPRPDSAGEQMSVVSESVNDTALGSGTRSVMVHYLDSAGVDRETTVIMDGTTPVLLTPSDVRFINDFHVQSSGEGLVTDGHVKLYRTSDSGRVYSMINSGGNKSMVPTFMVPTGHQLTVLSWHCEEAQAKRVNIRLRGTAIHNNLLENIFLFKDVAYLKQTTAGPAPVYETFPPLSVIKITGWPDAVGAEVSCGFLGELEALF